MQRQLKQTRNISLTGSSRISASPKLTCVLSLFRPFKISALVLLMAIMIFVGQSLKAQSFTEFDAETYRLYTEKNWKELVRTGREGLKKDFDYYYLRMRIGIAYYERENYKSAQSHFKKALEFNEEDPIALEYLYFSYLGGGQSQQAVLLYKSFTPSMKEKIPSHGQKIVERVSVEYLFNKTSTDDLIADPATFDGLPSGVQVITRSYHNMNIALSHYMHPGTSFTHAYTYLGKDNYYYYDDGSDRFGVDGQKVNQHQYYLSPSFTTGRGLVISPSFHFLYVGFQVPYMTAPVPGPPNLPPSGGSIAYTEDSESQLVGGLSLTKFQGPFSIRLGTIYSTLNNANQLTGSVGLTWYPLGNQDIYLGGSVNAHWGDLGERGLSLIQDFVFGYGIASKVWIEINASGGNMKNYTESNAYIVYNGLDWMRYKVLGIIIVPVTAKGSSFYVGVRYSDYGNRMITFDPALAENTVNELNFNSTSIFGGLSWKF
ncbi:tetratricopeptide repeat protein [Bacteroidota bacterium]